MHARATKLADNEIARRGNEAYRVRVDRRPGGQAGERSGNASGLMSDVDRAGDRSCGTRTTTHRHRSSETLPSTSTSSKGSDSRHQDSRLQVTHGNPIEHSGDFARDASGGRWNLRPQTPPATRSHERSPSNDCAGPRVPSQRSTPTEGRCRYTRPRCDLEQEQSGWSSKTSEQRWLPLAPCSVGGCECDGLRG